MSRILPLVLLLLFPVAGTSQDLQSRLDEAVRLIRSTEYEKALLQSRQIIEEAKRTGNHKILAEAYYEMGDANYYLGNIKMLKYYTEQALPHFKATNDLAGVARCYYQLSYCYERTDPQEMLRQLEIAKKYAVEAKDPSSQTVIENAFGTAYENLDRYRDAAAHYAESAKIAEREKSDHTLAIALSNEGQDYANLGDYEKAMLLLTRSFSIAKQTKDKRALAVVLSHRGEVYLTLGNADAALSNFLECLALYQESGYKRGQLRELRNIAGVYGWLGDRDAQENYSRKALVLSEELEDNFGTIALLNNLAESSTLHDRFQEAESYLQRAESLAGKHNNSFLLGSTKYAHSLLELRKGSYAAALHDLEGAEHNFNLANDPLDVAFAWSLRGRLFELQQKIPEAISSYQRAVALHESAHTYRSLPSWCVDIAKLSAEAGNHEMAGEYFEKSLSYVNKLDSLLIMDRFRLDLFHEVAEIYNSYALWLALQGRKDRAWEVLEEGRARALKYRMAQALENTTITDGERDCLGQLSKLQRSLREEELTGEEREDVLKKISTAEIKYEQASFHAAEGRPRVNEEKFNLHNPGSLTIEYAVYNDDLLIFSEDHGAIQFRKIPRASDLLHKARDFQEKSSNYREVQPEGLARELFQLLLAPELKNHNGGRVVLVPDDVLWSLPFSSLMDDDGRFVAEKYAVSIVPSVGTLTRLNQRRDSGRKNAVAFANTSFPDTQKSPIPLPPLPGATKEAEMFAKKIEGSRVMLDPDEASVKRIDFSSFGVIHFATHTLVDEAHPERSCIVLRADSTEDGYLQAREIYRMNMPAEMIVLSGCRSGAGNRVAGEGLIGLSHALFAAGGQTLITTLWEVSDEGTMEFMKRFYEELEDHSIADALQSAQVKMIHSGKWKNPGYWAAFVAMGNADHRLNVTWRKSHLLLWVFIGILSCAICALYFFKRKNTAHREL